MTDCTELVLFKKLYKKDYIYLTEYNRFSKKNKYI